MVTCGKKLVYDNNTTKKVDDLSLRGLSATSRRKKIAQQQDCFAMYLVESS